MTPEDQVQERLRAGDAEHAAAEAIRGFGPSILRYLKTALHDDDDAHDAFSVWAENVWRALPRFRGECTVRVWCYKLAWSAAMHVRDEAWRRRKQRLRTTMASRIAAEVHETSLRERIREEDRLERLRAALSPEERTLLHLYLEKRLSWREIADVLAADAEARVSEIALRKRYERLKTKLGRMARDEGFVE